MRCFPQLSRFLITVASFWSACVIPAVAKPKIAGLEFPIGENADRPIAKVSIAELGQSAQKRGFFRIALLPLTSAKGVEICFFDPTPEALLEIPKVIRGLSSVEAQEFYDVILRTKADTSPRLYAGEVVPKKDHWQLKRVKWAANGTQGEADDCQLLLHGPDCGKFVGTDAMPPIPLLQELLQTSQAP